MHGLLGCRRHAVTEELCHQVKEMLGGVSRLYSIRRKEKEVDWVFCNSLQLQELKSPNIVRERRDRKNLCLRSWTVETLVMMKSGDFSRHEESSCAI